MSTYRIYKELAESSEREVKHLKSINDDLLAALKAAGELWSWLPFDSGADIAEVAQRVKAIQNAAIAKAEPS